MRQKIALVSDIAVIVVAVLLGVVVVRSYFLPASKPRELLKVGDTLPNIELLSPSTSHSRRLLLILKKECPYCEGSTPLYKELAQLEETGQTDVKMVAVFQEPAEAGRSLLDAEGIRMEVVGSVPVSDLRVDGTPTLVLVDKAGRVLGLWEGMLSRKREGELKAALTLGGKT